MGYVEIFKPNCRGCHCALSPENAGKPNIVDGIAIFAYCKICKWSGDNE